MNNINQKTDTNIKAKHRILHTMLRVSDMHRSVDFYTRVLGMKVLRTLEHKEDKYQLTFLGYDTESTSCALELTYNDGITQYDIGTAYGHIAISVDNCRQSCEDIQAQHGKITLKPFPLKGSNEIIAFVSDPDGYQIELIQREDL